MTIQTDFDLLTIGRSNLPADRRHDRAAATEDRLLRSAGGSNDLFGGRAGRLAEAYRGRSAKVAAHFKA
jgi:hypothetical protein